MNTLFKTLDNMIVESHLHDQSENKNSRRAADYKVMKTYMLFACLSFYMCNELETYLHFGNEFIIEELCVCVCWH